jgi:tellurite methyltransferase
MSQTERAHWDSLYRRYADSAFPSPDPLLFDHTPPPDTPNQRALDLAGGQGQNGLWLASQGYVVDVLDISRVALMTGRAEMTRRGLRTINFLQADLDTEELKLNKYHLVCVFRFLKRDFFPQLRASIRPEGRIIYETYNTGYLEDHPDANPEHLIRPRELASHFPDWTILYQSDTNQISRLVALKPAY